MIYDLSTEPWIPLASPGGRVRFVGLEKALTEAHEFGRLTAETPLCEGALLRLLSAIAHRIACVSNLEEWLALKGQGKFDSDRVGEYFSQWRDKFYLLDPEYPFYQDASIGHVEAAPVSRLTFYSDARPLIRGRWEKASPPLLELSTVARYLLSYMTFDVGGFKSRALPGENHSAKEAPLRSASMLMIQGSNLFETILFNMGIYNPEAGQPWTFNPDLDLPAWERTDSNAAGPREPTGYLDWLTAQSRRILLHPEKNSDGDVEGVRWVSITKGENAEENFLHSHHDPMVPYRWVRRNKEVIQVPLRLFPDRGAWRDGYGLLCATGTKAVQCANVNFALSNGVIGGGNAPVDVQMVGMGTDRSKILFISSSGVRLPSVYFADDSEELRDALRCGMEIIEEGGSILRGVTREESPKALSNARGDESSGIFWATIESRFEAFAAELPESEDYGDRVHQLVNETVEVADRALEAIDFGGDRLMRMGRSSSKMRGILRSVARKIIEEGGKDDDSAN